ncbi:MAG: methyl-accepting chemotaxis protein [Duganella sp.]
MLSKLRIGPKLLLAPGVVLILLLVLAAGAYLGMVRQNQSLDNMMQERAVRLKAAADLVAGANRVHTEAYQLLTWLNAGFAPARTDALVRAIHARHAALDRQFAQLERLTQADPAERRFVVQSQAAHAQYVNAVADVIEIAIDDHAIAANAMSKAERAFDVVAQRLAELSRLEQALSASDYRDAEADFTMLSIWMPAMVVLSIGLSLLVTMAVRNALLRELREIGAAAVDLAEGNLTVRNRVYGKDEIAETSRALDTSIRNLNTTLKTIMTSAQTVDHASRKVARGNAELNRRTERQAASLQQATAAMRDLGASASQTAGNAQLANQLARCAATFAGRGVNVAQRLVLTMAALRGGSRKVVEIVGVIDGLAFQTNLLALDAAVAAARAGAQGDDFSRVANEVLALAQRSATAAHDIKALIHDSVAEVEGGAQSVADLGDNMAEIVASLQQVGQAMAQLGESTAVQLRGVEGAQLAILEIDQMTQHSLLLVRQAAADAGSLQRQAMHLWEAVALFRLEHPAGSGAGGEAGDAVQPLPPAGSPRVVRLRLASVRN